MGFIGRLDAQKGIDIILDSEDFLMNEDVQIVFLGSGRPDIQDRLYDFECRQGGKLGGRAPVYYIAAVHHLLSLLGIYNSEFFGGFFT